MNKKILLSILCAFLLLTTIPVAFSYPFNSTDETTLVVDTIGEPETVDPAWAYDSASSELIQNIYEPLAMHMVDRTRGPYDAGLVDQFTSKVAKPWEYGPLTIRPNLDGTFNTWDISPTSPTTHYDKVDEIAANEDTDYVYTNVDGEDESFALADLPAQALNPLRVKLIIVAKNTLASDENITSMLVIGGTKYSGTSFTPTTSYEPYSATWSVNPATGSTWTWSDINSLEAGVTSVETGEEWTGELRVTQLYVVVMAPMAPSFQYVDIPDYVQNGVTIKYRFYFEINVGIPFHPGGDGTDWGTLSTEDVEYSFERAMVQDRDGGPQWMLYQYLLNASGARSPASDPNWGLKIDHSIERDDTHVWFNIASDFSNVTIMQINALVGGIVCKAWAQSLGDLNVESIAGGWTNWQEIYFTWHNPPTSFIEYDITKPETKPVGTGPYKFEYWTHGASWSVSKFDDYWDGWPSKVIEDPVDWDGSDNRLPSVEGGNPAFISTVIWRYYPMWTTRRPNLLGGISDMTYVDRIYRNQILGQPGIRCYYPFEVLALDAFFFTFDITTTSPYLGVPGGRTPGTFGTDGIPPDIFSNINVRKGFAYAFDYNAYIANAYLGEGAQPPTYHIPQLSYYNPNQWNYKYNPNMAEAYLRWAWGGSWPAPLFTGTAASGTSTTLVDPTLPSGFVGNFVNFTSGSNLGQFRHITVSSPGFVGFEPDLPNAVAPGDQYQIRPMPIPGALWTGGMKFTVTYNTGNVARRLAAEMITSKINSLNPTMFKLDPPVGVPWGSTYLPTMVHSELPIFIIGWGADYPDPHDFAHPFMHSQGTFAAWQKYDNPTVDAQIKLGIQTPAGPLRRAIYYALQSMYITDVPSVTIVQPIGRHWERDWVRGWYFHPLYGGSLTPGIDSTAPTSPTLYVYHLWKSNSTELGDANNDGAEDGSDKAYISAHWTGAPLTAYNPAADISGGTGGIIGSLWGLVGGIPDGKVDIVDLGVLNDSWD